MAAADYRLMTEATGQRIAIALENLAGFGAYLTTADVVNSLTSTATDKPLSAAQGKELNDILSITPKIKTTTITGTTNASGNLLYSDFTGTRVIGAESNNSIVFPFLSGDYYYFKVLSWDDMSQKANASVTITVIYY